MKKLRFWLVIGFFTLTVPGFIFYSYWHLGVFSSITLESVANQKFILLGGVSQGDYNNTGAEVVKTRDIFNAASLRCRPALLYKDNPAKIVKPQLRSVGGCLVDEKDASAYMRQLKASGRVQSTAVFQNGIQISMYGQTAVALRRGIGEVERLAKEGRNPTYPLLQLVDDDGTNHFFISLAK